MFEKATDLELALLYRALNTERNLVEKLHKKELERIDYKFHYKGFTEQLNALDHLLKEYENESDLRYWERVRIARLNEDMPI